MACTVGTHPRARGRRGQTQSQYYNATGMAFGRRITGRNGYSVTNLRNRPNTSQSTANR